MIHNVLFLCTGNSARSILGEAIVNHLGEGRFRGFSAGSHPKGQVHPYALELLTSLHLPTQDLSSKSWDLFADDAAPRMDFVFTVCDSAAGEPCPIWPGHPMVAHWGLPDPAAVSGSPETCRAAFREAYAALEGRIRGFLSLPVATLDKATLKKRLDAIGHELAA
jgi:arsenate reductase